MIGLGAASPVLDKESEICVMWLCASQLTTRFRGVNRRPETIPEHTHRQQHTPNGLQWYVSHYDLNPGSVCVAVCHLGWVSLGFDRFRYRYCLSVPMPVETLIDTNLYGQGVNVRACSSLHAIPLHFCINVNWQCLKGLIHPKTMFGWKTRSFYIAVGGGTLLGLTGSI